MKYWVTRTVRQDCHLTSRAPTAQSLQHYHFTVAVNALQGPAALETISCVALSGGVQWHHVVHLPARLPQHAFGDQDPA